VQKFIPNLEKIFIVMEICRRKMILLTPKNCQGLLHQRLVKVQYLASKEGEGGDSVVFMVDDRHVAFNFCDFRGGVAKIVCVT